MSQARNETIKAGDASEVDPHCVYIAGTGRNGSTVLGMLLAQHPDVFFAGELTHIWRRGFLENQLCSCGRPFHTCDFWRSVAMDCFGDNSESTLSDVTKLRDHLSAFANLPRLLLGQTYLANDSIRYSRIYRELLNSIARISGRRVIVDSSKYPTDLAALLQPNQPMWVIHLVRDCRAVVYSWRTSKRRPEIHWKDEDMPRYGPVQTALAWRLFNSTIERLVSDRGAGHQVLRYEDLVAGPEMHGKKLLDWVGLERLFEQRQSTACDHSVSGNPCRFQSGKLKIAGDERWRDGLSRWESRVVSLICGSMQRKYGYGD
ncbi:MAG: sulfotransferase [Planctomycetota bacterium]